MGAVSDDPAPSEGPSKGFVVKSSLGVLGALATIVSVWWFALRPRRRGPSSDDAAE